MAANETYIPNRLYMIALSELLPDPDQPRKYLDRASWTSQTSLTKNGTASPMPWTI